MQREFIATLDWVQKVLTDKEKGRHWQKWNVKLTPPSKMLNEFSFLPDLSCIAHLPLLSFILHIPFRLRKPYISRDERDFHLLENPLRREIVFQTPMVASTSWKGALRAALWRLGYKEDHEITIRLMGNPRESEEQQAGRLHFFSSFFDKIRLEASNVHEKIGLEVINPHDRKTGVGARGPILLECVPSRATGEFVLLYVSFGPTDQSETDKRNETAQDLEVLVQGIHAMLTTYGFGAKTSSGFGTVDTKLPRNGTLAIRFDLPDQTTQATASSETQLSDLPRYLESDTRLSSDLCRPDGSLKTEAEYQDMIESRGNKYTKKNKRLYAKAKGWWERKGKDLIQSASEEPEPEPTPLEKPVVSEYEFHSLSELRDLVQRLSDNLREGDGG